MKCLRPFALWVVCSVVLAGPSLAGEERFGTVNFPVSCSPAARQQFNHAVALLHSFSFTEVFKAFEAVAHTDPTCGMAYWGVAMSPRMNPPLGPMTPKAVQGGWEAILEAAAA